MYGDCEKLAEQAEAEPNLVKRGIAYAQIGQCYKGLNNDDQHILMMQRAIEAFHAAAGQTDDAYEKSLLYSYEALCWISLKELERARETVNFGLDLCKIQLNLVPPIIIRFTDNLISQNIEEAEKLWGDLYQNFDQGIIELLKEAFCTINPSTEPPCLTKGPVIAKKWCVLLVGKEHDDPSRDWPLEFLDADSFLGKELILKPEFMKDLLERMKESKHYRFLRIIKTIISSDNEDLTDKAVYLILATSAEENLRIGIMLGSLKEGGLHVIAIWPEAFAQAISENNDILFGFMTRLVKDPQWFLDVNILSFLEGEDEPEIKEEGHLAPNYFI